MNLSYLTDYSISCVIIDDQDFCIEALSRLVAKTPNLDLKYTSVNPIEGLNYLKKSEATIDVVFLDVDMPELTGLEFIRLAKVTNPHTQFIFTTAHAQYAVDGFDHEVLDFLIKPIKLDRFLKAIDKAEKLLSLLYRDEEKPPIKVPIPSNEQANAFHLSAPSAPAYIILPSAGKGKQLVTFSDIRYVESFRKYLLIHRKEDSVSVPLTMEKLESLLPSDLFIRVHKSFIIAVEHISLINSNTIILKSSSPKQGIPIGATYRKYLMTFLESNKY